MDRIMQSFKDFDMQLLLDKRRIVAEEIEKNKELQSKLIKLLERIENSIEELKNMNYDSD